MYCKNCGTELKNPARFCPNCGASQDEPGTGQDTRAGGIAGGRDASHAQDPPRPKKTGRKLPLWVPVLAVIVVVIGVFIYFNRGLNLSKFDRTNGNAISTSWFQELASNKDKFRSYNCSDYTKKKNASGPVLVQEAKSTEHGPLQGIYLLTYENEYELQEYAYDDILRIMREQLNTNVSAIKTSADDFYFIDGNGGGFGSHTYCFCLVGNSMIYAVKHYDEDVDQDLEDSAYGYLLDIASQGQFDIPDSDFVNCTDQFLEDINKTSNR